MTDKELIKQEIEKRVESMSSCPFKTAELGSEKFDEGELYAYKQILQFIDSLPEQPISEDWEEEMIRWHKEHFGNKRDWGKTSGEYLTRKSQLDLAHHFAEWQKQQMMKDAVEAEVFTDYNINFGYGSLTANIDLDEQHLKEGDKVKIIIVKTE